MKKFLLALSLFALMGADDDGCVADPEHMQKTADGRCKDSTFKAQLGIATACPDGTRMEAVPQSTVIVCRCPTGGGR